MNYNVLRIISQVLDLDLSHLTVQEVTPALIEKWDSVSHLMIIVSLEEEFDVVFEPEEIEEALDGAIKIFDILTRKGK